MGDEGLVKEFLKRKLKVKFQELEAAVMSGNLEIVQLMLSNYRERESEKIEKLIKQ